MARKVPVTTVAMVWQAFKLENLPHVQTPATIIHLTEIHSCFYLRNDHTDSCLCWNWKETPDPFPLFHKLLTPGPVFHKFLTPDPGPKEKRRILLESTPALRIHGHLWWQRRIFIFGALGYFVLGLFWKAEVSVVTPLVPKFLHSDPGPKNFKILRIQLLFRLRLPSMQLKLSNVFA